MPKEKRNILTPITISKIDSAVGSILAGECTRVDVSDSIKVYMCKNVIRIDLKLVAINNEG